MKERFYVHWMYLIKEVEKDNGDVSYQAKMVFDSEIREELLYWWSDIDPKKADTLDKVKSLLK